MTSKEIARQIGVAPTTVDNHIRTAMARLQVANRREAIRLVRMALSNPPDAHMRSAKDFLKLPPFGGAENALSRSQRLFHVVQISVLGTMSLAALIATIVGLVRILNH